MNGKLLKCIKVTFIAAQTLNSQLGISDGENEGIMEGVEDGDSLVDGSELGMVEGDVESEGLADGKD